MKKFNEMSNQDIEMEKLVLENEYEVIKNDMTRQYEKLDELERKYAALENELRRRKRVV